MCAYSSESLANRRVQRVKWSAAASEPLFNPLHVLSAKTKSSG
jgi:hypothetical protein